MTLPALKKAHEKHNAAWLDGVPAHYGSPEEEYALLRRACGWLDFSHLAMLRFTGEDRMGWLQGQLSNDLRRLADGDSIECCVLTPTGQVLADVDLWALPDEYVALLPGTQREAVKRQLDMMLILEDVQIEDLSQRFGLISVQGPEASGALGKRLELPRLDAGAINLKGADIRLLRHNRSGAGGWDLLFAEDAAQKVLTLLSGIPPVGTQAWEIARIESGIPAYGKDMDQKTLVMEMGRRFIDSHLSLTKGCYTGQEVVMRIHARGHTNRTWVGLHGDRPIPVGALVSHTSHPDAGRVTSTAISPELGPIAAAMMRNEAAHPRTRVLVNAPDGPVEAEVAEMPIRRP